MMPQQYGQPNPGAAQMSQQIAQSLKQQPIQSDIRKPLAGQDPTQEQYNG
jgi:predicted kinase